MGTDGQGIRTLIVVSDCPLRCKYCINPFTWNGSAPSKFLTAQDILKRTEVDTLYMLATKGGFTFGGGEPLLYPDLIKEFRSICDSDLTIYVETCLNVPFSNIESIMDAVDYFIVDIKTMDEEIYTAYTGGQLSVALDNLKKLAAVKGDSILVRIPIIPGYVDKEGQLLGREKLLELGIKKIDLCRYKV